jgi:hypothetical protein
LPSYCLPACFEPSPPQQQQQRHLLLVLALTARAQLLLV